MSHEQIHPQRAIDLFLKERKPEVAKQTQYNQQGHLKRLKTFLETEEIEDMAEIDGFMLRDFKHYLREEREINQVTMSNYVGTTRAFIKWAGKLELVDDKLFEKMDYPHLTAEEESRDVSIDPEVVDDILDYLYKFEYASLRHTLFQLIWHTTFRIGTVRALDLDDWKSGPRYLIIRHRPDTGTPLKNKQAAERELNMGEDAADVLDDYIKIHRHNVVDEHGREPLFTSKTGRAYDSLIRKHINCITRPCHYTGECPHGREQQSCEAWDFDAASKCPSSISPHPLRRSSITYHLNNEWPVDLVSERAGVSTDVLEQHYDVRSQEEKRQNRKRYLGNL